MPTTLAGFGIGDALRIAAVLKRQLGPHTVRVESEPYDTAAQVFESLRFIEQVERIPRGEWDASPLETRADTQCPEALHYTSRIADGPLRLAASDFKLPLLPWTYYTSLPKRPYIAVQPETNLNKYRALAPMALESPVVLLGLPGRPWSGTSHQVVDFRGKLTIAESVQVVGYAMAVAGVESWVPILGALLGKPTLHQISRRADRDLRPNWSILFPTMGFRVEDE